eukprot:CAMPEP_0179168558 /NCGR_PEP_ID=MMETSP0796-20121207/82919_1 /TAXON_ID=73915 /ORGANISM="Pyrodinium bahamense, Strain pbaha01" /LENGTH=358 /DNA_ID=CAMNT_0020871327 /DNA_START=90 /DNA_END=1164 /DNA_ORIENTATION=+
MGFQGSFCALLPQAVIITVALPSGVASRVAPVGAALVNTSHAWLATSLHASKAGSGVHQSLFRKSRQPWYHPEVDEDIMRKIAAIHAEILAARRRLKEAREEAEKAKALFEEAAAHTSAGDAAYEAAKQNLADAAKALLAAERDASASKELLSGQRKELKEEERHLKEFQGELDGEFGEIEELKNELGESQAEADRVFSTGHAAAGSGASSRGGGSGAATGGGAHGGAAGASGAAGSGSASGAAGSGAASGAAGSGGASGAAGSGAASGASGRGEGNGAAANAGNGLDGVLGDASGADGSGAGGTLTMEAALATDGALAMARVEHAEWRTAAHLGVDMDVAGGRADHRLRADDGSCGP